MRSIRTITGATAVAAAALLLGGCSVLTPKAPVTVTVTAGAPRTETSAGSSAVASITPAASLSTACQLLTLKEAEAIVGTTLLPGQEGNPQQPTCTFNPDPKGTKTAQVAVYTEGAAESFYDTDKRLKHAFTSVSGIGDEAHQEDFQIFFRKGTILAAVGCLVLDSPDTVNSQLQQAAKLIVSRLP